MLDVDSVGRNQGLAMALSLQKTFRGNCAARARSRAHWSVLAGPWDWVWELKERDEGVRARTPGGPPHKGGRNIHAVGRVCRLGKLHGVGIPLQVSRPQTSRQVGETARCGDHFCDVREESAGWETKGWGSLRCGESLQVGRLQNVWGHLQSGYSAVSRARYIGTNCRELDLRGRSRCGEWGRDGRSRRLSRVGLWHRGGMPRRSSSSFSRPSTDALSPLNS